MSERNGSVVLRKEVQMPHVDTAYRGSAGVAQNTASAEGNAQPPRNDLMNGLNPY